MIRESRFPSRPPLISPGPFITLGLSSLSSSFFPSFFSFSFFFFFLFYLHFFFLLSFLSICFPFPSFSRFFANSILYQVNTSAPQERTGTLNYVHRAPVGVAGLISPVRENFLLSFCLCSLFSDSFPQKPSPFLLLLQWNLPLYLLTWKIAPCLAFGNTCVCKPSEFTSVTAWMLCDVLKEAQVPPGVVNMIFGTGPKAGQAIVSHPDIPLVSFTGGTATGERIIRDSAPFYKKLSLELGGKNPGIVFEDADMQNCVPTLVRAGFSNQGEICLCSSRLFVHEKVYDEFVRKYTEEVRKIRVGDPRDGQTQMGPLVSREHLNKVMSYVKLSREIGGKIECGGEQPKLTGDLANGYFLEPTVVTGLPYDAAPCMEEIFGPVVTITKFKTEEEVVEWSNAVKYGLAASIWTENVSRMHRVAQLIEAGTVWCNCWMIRDLRMPFGGSKASGTGREGMTHSAEFFTEEKTICLKFA